VKFLGLENSIILIWAPKIAQAFFATLADYYTFLLAHRMFGEDTAQWTVILFLISVYLYVNIMVQLLQSLSDIFKFHGDEYNGHCNLLLALSSGLQIKWKAVNI
jgi:hypothetical protein